MWFRTVSIAEVELTCDLLGGAAMLEETQQLGLPRRQLQVRWRRRVVLFASLIWPKTPITFPPLRSGTAPAAARRR
jgi:hypothetical protein